MFDDSIVIGIGNRSAIGIGNRSAIGIGNRSAIGIGNRSAIGIGNRSAIGIGNRSAIGIGNRSAIGIGNRSAISTSKIMKITAIKKNRDEKGSRAQFFGSNPHSNGDLFSRSSFIFLEISVVNTIMAADNIMAAVAAVIVIIITDLVFHEFLDWKSSILSCIG